MITNLSIENFKSFSKKQELKLAPITLIYGPNSSGKSSVIQALMMLKQTILAKEANGRLITNGNFINLGSYKSLVHGQDIEKDISISVEYTQTWDAQEFKYKYDYPMPFANKEKRNLALQYSNMDSEGVLEAYAFGTEKSNEDKFNISLGRNTKTNRTYYLAKNVNEMSEGIWLRLKEKGRLTAESIKYKNQILHSSLSPFISSHHINLPVPVSEHNLLEVCEFFNKINDDIENLVSAIKYLGPLRSSPKRFYSSERNVYQQGKGKNNLGLELFNAIDSVREPINCYLEQFEIPYKIDAENIGNDKTGDVISILLEDLRNNTFVTPTDVGFGIGQVLPIILESLVSKHKVLSVEQPEIHLHPKLQAHLADLFIDSIKNNNQWIIETHSESLMLRIQRRIREGKISNSDVSVLYVDCGDNGAKITPLSLDEEGDFNEHWPNGFFEERLDEV